MRSLLDKLVRSLSYDFCPGANQYVYWLKKPVGWVVTGALFSLLVGLFVGPQGYVLMWALLALLVMGVVWPWLSMKGLKCRVYFRQSRIVEGSPTIAILEVTNHWPIPAFGLILHGDFLQDVNCEDDMVAVGLRRVPAWSVSTFEWKIEPGRRGRLPVKQPQLTNGFPFGLYNASKDIDVEGSTIVWPLFGALDDIPDFGGLQFNVDGIASDRAGNEGETIGIRDYRHGDPIKSIHWVHTARCDRLIVRERQTLSQMPVQVVVDLSHASHSGNGSESTYEQAIRVASSVCRKLHLHQARIELNCLGLPLDVASRTDNRKGIKGVLDFLALLPQFDEESPAQSQRRIPSTIQAENRYLILIHTDRFAGKIKPSKLLWTICLSRDDSGKKSFDELSGVGATRTIPNAISNGRTDDQDVTAPAMSPAGLAAPAHGGVHVVG